MTRRLRRMVWGAAVAALIMSCGASESFAVEPGDFTNYLRGATQGLPLGALPPPGCMAVSLLTPLVWAARPAKVTRAPGSRPIRHLALAKACCGCRAGPSWGLVTAPASCRANILDSLPARSIRRSPRAGSTVPNLPTQTSRPSPCRGPWAMAGSPVGLTIVGSHWLVVA